MSRRLRFAHAPRAASDELLGSWLARLARRHGTSVSTFLQSGGAPRHADNDLDWAADPELLAWLSYGSDIPQARLAAMTLRRRYPMADPDHFAWSRGATFAGRHAFCRVCARLDIKRYGAVISRCADAGLWRLACTKHRVLLDSVSGPSDLANPQGVGGYLAQVIVRSWDAVEAPPFCLSFQLAAEQALEGRPLSKVWKVRAPDAFLSLTVTVASLMLVQLRPGTPGSSAASALLGDDALTAVYYGAPDYDADLVRRAPSYARVRAFAATAVLLLRPAYARRLGVVAWAERHSPYRSPSLMAENPWAVAAEAWSRRTLELVRGMSQAWPAAVAEDASAAVRQRLSLIGAL